MSGERPPDRLALSAFVGAVVIGGSNFVAVRFSNRELDPLWGAFLRFALAAAVFAALVALLRLPLPRGRALGPAALYGLLGFAGTYGCLYWALQDVPAGIGAVVMAIGPLLTLLLAVAHGLERLTVRALAGAIVALGGTTLIFFQSGTGEYRWESYALLIAAVLCASEAVIVSKRIGPQHPVVTNAVCMTAGAAVLLVAAAVAGESFALPAEGETQLAVLYLVAATVGLFLLVLYVVQRWTASATAYVFVLMPIVALAVGALIADEEITATTILGGAVVCAGVYLGALSRRG
jgi:drug/metabolite transporter (DMT)-like permease